MTWSERKEPSVAEGLFREFIQAHRGHPWEAKAWENWATPMATSASPAGPWTPTCRPRAP